MTSRISKARSTDCTEVLRRCSATAFLPGRRSARAVSTRPGSVLRKGIAPMFQPLLRHMSIHAVWAMAQRVRTVSLLGWPGCSSCCCPPPSRRRVRPYRMMTVRTRRQSPTLRARAPRASGRRAARRRSGSRRDRWVRKSCAPGARPGSARRAGGTDRGSRAGRCRRRLGTVSR